MTVNLQGESSRTAPPKPPYSPSWLNRLLDWIDARPGPAWPYFLAGVILSGLLFTLAIWMIDGLTVGTIDTEALLFSIYPIYFIALMHYLDGEAKSALANFRPVLQVSEVEYA